MLDFSMMGKRIKQRRKELNITQNQFAEMLQISNNHLSTIENGKGHTSMELFCQICVALNVILIIFYLGSYTPMMSPSISRICFNSVMRTTLQSYKTWSNF